MSGYREIAKVWSVPRTHQKALINNGKNWGYKEYKTKG